MNSKGENIVLKEKRKGLNPFCLQKYIVAEVIDFAGVDLIEGDEGLFVREANATPSGKGIKLACGIDVTGWIIGRMFERVFGVGD